MIYRTLIDRILVIAVVAVLAACGPKSKPEKPESDAALVFPDEPFRATQPEAAKPRPLQIPDIATFKLDNGLEVYLVERHELPIVSISLNIDGGSKNDPAGKEGLAGMCMAMMSEGTQELEKIPFNEALADIASSVSSSAGLESQNVSMRTLSKHFDATYALWKDTLLTPGFRQSDFDRLRDQALDGLKQARADTSSVASRVQDQILYGTGHPFGMIETETSFRSLTLGDCVTYHKQYVKPSGSRLFVVGDMTEAKVRAKFGAAALAGWSGVPKASVVLPKPASMKGKLFFVHVPNAEQSRITFMHFGPGRMAADYYENRIMSIVLGGGFSSRLNMNLREDKNYSYGAGGGLRYTRDYGYFFATTKVRANATWQSVKEIFMEVDGLKTGSRPATTEELSREKNGIILGLPGRFATMQGVLSAYRNLVYYGLPMDWWKSYVGKIGAVTLDQVNASAKKYLQPKAGIILVVGNAESLQIRRDGKNDLRLEQGGTQTKLIDALKSLLASGELGETGLVMMDADGKVLDAPK